MTFFKSMKIKTLVLLSGASMTGFSLAGEDIDFLGDPTGTVSSSGETRHFCDAFKDLGLPIKSDSNPFIQEVKFSGRAHFQYGYTNGDVNGTDFSETGEELRRLRLGAKVKFLNKLKAS